MKTCYGCFETHCTLFCTLIFNIPIVTVKEQDALLPILSSAIHVTSVGCSAVKSDPDTGVQVTGGVVGKLIGVGFAHETVVEEEN